MAAAAAGSWCVYVCVQSNGSRVERRTEEKKQLSMLTEGFIYLKIEKILFSK
jgi:hypothetical protein